MKNSKTSMSLYMQLKVKMMNKIKNYDNITNNLITNVNMLINPKNFKNSNIKKFYKNISDEKEKNITSNNTIKNFKNNIDEKNFFSKKGKQMICFSHHYILF